MGQKPENAATRVSSFVLLIIFVTLALSLAALILAVNWVSSDIITAGWLILIGFVGVALSAYFLLQVRRHVTRSSVAVPPIMTTIECRKCGFKNVREFQRGDFVFKELDPCQKCNEKMMITSIYREIKEKEKERLRF